MVLRSAFQETRAKKEFMVVTLRVPRGSQWFISKGEALSCCPACATDSEETGGCVAKRCALSHPTGPSGRPYREMGASGK